jgi:stringent starvation protein B
VTTTPNAPPPGPPMKARRPYLLRAIHEWITDSLCTPHMVVDAGMTGVEVPRQFVQDGKIVLNVSWTATANLRMTNDDVSFSGRFGGTSMSVHVPMAAVLAIYARETGQGMIFNDDDAPPPSPPGERGDSSKPAAPPPDDKPPKPTSPSDERRAKFKIVK